MGLLLYDGALITNVCMQKSKKDNVVCLGEPLLYFSAKNLYNACYKLGVKFPSSLDKTSKRRLGPEEFFKALGFEQYQSLDYDGYEGSKIIHDLNNPVVAEKYHGIADFIYDTGTFEHVFNIPNGFSSVHQLLNEEGMIYHTNPSNGYLDHGFYQISPTLYYDYYKKNKYSIISAHVLDLSMRGQVYCEPYTCDIYRIKGTDYPMNRLARGSVSFCAQKHKNSTMGEIPIQSYYSQLHSEFRQEYESLYKFQFNVFSLKDWLVTFIPKGLKSRLQKLFS